jgi:tRNA(Ile)-lysidine synthase
VEDVHGEICAFLRANGVSRGERLLVGVSGGADSTALAHALCALGVPIAIAHVHHGMRGAPADADEAFAAGLARRLAADFRLARVDAGRRDGRSPEARARALRYAALEAERAAAGCAWIATAHTLDDQAETVLLRALRGTSPLGLAAIRPCDPERRLLRPLLRVRRLELRAYLSARGETWREDETNSSLALPRNRLRAEVLPALERVQPDAVPKLARLAQQIRAWAEPRRRELVRCLDEGTEPGEGGEWLELEVLVSQTDSERAEILAAWIGPPLSFGHVQRAAELAAHGPMGRSVSLPGDRVLFRDRNALWLGPAPGPVAPAPLERWLEPPASWSCAERGLGFRWQRIEEAGSALPGWAIAADARVCVRNPAPGDAIVLEPCAEPRPLRMLFQRAAWSRRQRARAVVVEHEGRVVWVPGLVRATPANELRHGWKLVAVPLSTPGDSC